MKFQCETTRKRAKNMAAEKKTKKIAKEDFYDIFAQDVRSEADLLSVIESPIPTKSLQDVIAGLKEIRKAPALVDLIKTVERYIANGRDPSDLNGMGACVALMAINQSYVRKQIQGATL